MVLFDLGLSKPSSYMNKRLKYFVCFSMTSFFMVSGVFFSTSLRAQKKPLTHDVYDGWQSFGERHISANGKWSVYRVKPQQGDGELFIQSNSRETPRLKVPRGEKAQITADAEQVVFLIKPFYKEIKKHRVAKKKKKKNRKELTKDSLGIYRIADKRLEKIPEVKSFKLPKENGRFLAYLRELKIEEDTTKKTYRKLVLRDLHTGKEKTFKHVDQYKFSKDGETLVYTIKNPEQKEKHEEAVDSLAEGIYMVNTSTFKAKPVLDKKGLYLRLRFNEDADLLTFLGTQDEKDKEIKDYQLYVYNIEKEKLHSINNKVNGMPEDWVISKNSTPRFSKDSGKLFFGIAPQKEPKDTTFIEEDHAKLDIWHYKDDYLQPQQLAHRKKNLKKSYLAVVHLEDRSKIIPLQDKKMNYVRLVDEGNATFVYGMSDYGHRIAQQWTDEAERSYYLIDTHTGKKTKILEGLIGSASISPKGKSVVYYDRPSANWYVYDIADKETKQLNKDLNVSFARERDDRPHDPYSYSIVGWTDNDESVLINDRYDIWEFFLNSTEPPRNITGSYGRNNAIRFSYVKLDREARHIPRKESLVLSAFRESTKESGFYKVKVGNSRLPKKLLMEPMSGHKSLSKAKDQKVYTYIRQSFEVPPTLVSSKNLKRSTALHKTNPQQENYNWGTVELIHYTALNGKPAVGMLYKPENFDKAKQYPLLLYFYERKSDGLHHYEAPAPTPSRLNITYFVSNDYLVFVPDIEFTVGHPGRSAAEYIDAGIDYLTTFDWVNEDKIGIQGQSWGGYEVAYLITQSDRYTAAWTGAPVVNMTSAYGGIRWSSGKNRQFQYEKTQSRIGKNLWDGLDLYLENSPLFHLDHVSTPVVIMHNDGDGSVPWYQGIEMFTALRRLQKPVWLLNYNGDAHNLMKRENRKDVQRREQQFFDYYLKDARAPEWMVDGIPAVKKGKTWGFELTDEEP